MKNRNRMFYINERLRTNFYLEVIAKCALYFVGILATCIGIGLFMAEAWIGLGCFIVATLFAAAAKSDNNIINQQDTPVVGSSDSSETDPKEYLTENGGSPPLAPRLTQSSSSEE